MIETCPFCSYASGQFPRDLLVYEDAEVLVMPAKHQKHKNRGHCLVVTRAHVSNLYELPHELAAPVLRSLSAAAVATKGAFSADGVSIRQNNEPAGGQDVSHLHFHVVPRFLKDDYETAHYVEVDESVHIQQAEALRRSWPV